jgi:hypothetical protein
MSTTFPCKGEYLALAPRSTGAALEHEQMAWVVRYWDEINKRNITSREISTREDAMDEACSLMQRHTVSHVAGPNGERIDIKEIREWCSAQTSR